MLRRLESRVSTLQMPGVCKLTAASQPFDGFDQQTAPFSAESYTFVANNLCVPVDIGPQEAFSGPQPSTLYNGRNVAKTQRTQRLPCDGLDN